MSSIQSSTGPCIQHLSSSEILLYTPSSTRRRLLLHAQHQQNATSLPTSHSLPASAGSISRETARPKPLQRSPDPKPDTSSPDPPKYPKPTLAPIDISSTIHTTTYLSTYMLGTSLKPQHCRPRHRVTSVKHTDSTDIKISGEAFYPAYAYFSHW